MRRRQYGDAVYGGGKLPGADRSLQSRRDEHLIDSRRQFPGHPSFAAESDVVDDELHDDCLADRQSEFDAVAGAMPARPIAQSASVAARGVRGGRFRQQLAHGLGGRVRQLRG